MCQGSIALDYKGLYADTYHVKVHTLHNLGCRKWPQVGPGAGLAGGCSRATGLWISSHGIDSKGSLASATCTCWGGRGCGELTLKMLRQGENPDKNGKGGLAYLIKSSLCDTTFRESNQAACTWSSSTISQSEWPSLPLPTSFTIKQSFSHYVWWLHLSVTSIPHCDYTIGRYLSLVSFSPSYSTSIWPQETLEYLKEASTMLFLVWNTFICPPFTWLRLHVLWGSAYASLLRKCSLVPWLE